MAEVKGAGSTEMRENPPVHSKGQRHGIPFHPSPVERPGGVAAAPMSGTKVPLHSAESGHREPRHVPHEHEKHVVTRVAPPKHDEHEALDRAKSGSKYPGDKT